MTQLEGCSRKLVLWSIDPFETETKPKRAVQEELKTWLEKMAFEVQPVYVLGLSQADLSHEPQGNWLNRYIPLVKKMLTEYMEEMGISQVRKPKIIVEQSSFVSRYIDSLLQYAEESQAQWILVSSRGRSGLSRVVLGSFAESLILKSPVPVWVFGHGDPAQLSLNHLVFATDFSDESKKALNEVVQQARVLNSEIVLFHKIAFPQAMMTGSGLNPAPYMLVDEYLQDQRKWAEKTAEEWVGEVKAAGVLARYVMETGMRPISETILACAKENDAGLIAMASKSGPVAAAVIGSNAREVIRQSDCPVCVFGSGYFEKFRAIDCLT